MKQIFKKYIIVNDNEIVFASEDLNFIKRFIDESINPQLYKIYELLN
jgi:hypothetical protein